MSTKLYDFLKGHAVKNPVSFHMPGHKGSHLYKRFGYTDFLHDFLDFDITELWGADNLFQAEGILKDVQHAYATLYEVPYSYLLINGTSSGIIASILACVPKGKKLLMARNCHKSVFNTLVLGDITPVYAYPDVLPGWGISGALSPDEIEKQLSSDTDIEAVILPSPNYYGICSDIAAIAEIVHRYGKILIVDQAHGAHLKFFSKMTNRSENMMEQSPTEQGLIFPKSAEELGADIVINSIHKTLASMTQSAVLNLNSDRVDRYALEDKLQMIQSTSPSYILMTSLDINCDMLTLHGEALIRQWSENLDYFYAEAQKIEGLRVMKGLDGLDHTKINLDMSHLGVSGAKLEKLLLYDDIFVELYTGHIVMCMTGIGNRRSDYTRLLDALRRITTQEPAFAFEDIVRLDGPSLQRVLREVDLRELAVAIVSADQVVRDVVFRNLSTRAAKLLKEEIELFGPVKPGLEETSRNRMIEAARKHITDVVLRLDAVLEIMAIPERHRRSSVMVAIGSSDSQEQREKQESPTTDEKQKHSDFLTKEEVDALLKASTNEHLQVMSASGDISISVASDVFRAKLVAIPKNKRRIKLDDAVGAVAASNVIPYPPGIPIICPGEIIEQIAIDHIRHLRDNGEKVIGVTDMDEIWVGN